MARTGRGCCGCRYGYYVTVRPPTFGVPLCKCFRVPDAPDEGNPFENVRLLLTGAYDGTCSEEYSWPSEIQTQIKERVEAGMRLFIPCENIHCYDLAHPGNSTRYNNFLGYLGSGLQLTANFPFGCPETSDSVAATKAEVGIMEDLPDEIGYIAGGEISGGTALAYTSTIYTPNGCGVEHVLMAADQVGDGLVVACASSYIVPGCEFFKRLCTWSVDDILESTA